MSAKCWTIIEGMRSLYLDGFEWFKFCLSPSVVYSVVGFYEFMVFEFNMIWWLECWTQIDPTWINLLFEWKETLSICHFNINMWRIPRTFTNLVHHQVTMDIKRPRKLHFAWNWSADRTSGFFGQLLGFRTRLSDSEKINLIKFELFKTARMYNRYPYPLVTSLNIIMKCFRLTLTFVLYHLDFSLKLVAWLLKFEILI